MTEKCYLIAKKSDFFQKIKLEKFNFKKKFDYKKEAQTRQV